MRDVVAAFEAAVLWIVWSAVALVLTAFAAVVIERIALARYGARRRSIEARYGSVIDAALAGDIAARQALTAVPARHRIDIARLVITPLVDDRDPARIAAARDVARALSILPLARRYLGSLWWWRRVLALRALGLIQEPGHTASIVAALDDRHVEVRGAALDALADLQDPSALPALVTRMLDETLPEGRRAAALAAFGSQCEELVLDRGWIDRGQRSSYARVLAVCGTARARPVLCEWMDDRRADVRISALRALSHVGLDERAASAALAALESPVLAERAMAATALRGWTGTGEAAARLANHLGDEWPVAVSAARALLSMDEAGRRELGARAARPDLTGLLARQMLWEANASC